MKIIGIINRNETLKSGNKIQYIYEDIIKKIIKSGGIPIGINIKNIKQIINKLDGLILQGGDTYTEEEVELVKYAHEYDIPTLGICQGMQIMGIATCGELYCVKNHNKKNITNVHDIIIKKNSKIYKILNKEKIIVNSRHNYAIKNTTLEITGISNGNIIEIIEDKTKTFFIGVEWHPESLNNEDSDKLFNYFVNVKEGNK